MHHRNAKLVIGADIHLLEIETFAKQELLRDVWGYRTLGTTRTLDSHACRLRNKLGVDGDRFVVNVWGVGYRLIVGPVAEPVAA